ncbi:MAG TPA: cyclic nucleotide-binding domain-containing protein [Jatrophihabitans sp.]|nr:cyclic nucleotide-binding domain-containing protein [Jatrophihabitans sp.]
MAGADKRELVSQLSGYTTFADCSKDDVAALVDAGGPFTLPAGWPLVEQGIPADAVYVLTDGEARVFYVREQVATLGPGDIVGEMALLGGGQRRATVTTATRVSGLRVENTAMMNLFSKHPALREAFRAAYESHQAGSATRD